MVEEYTTADLNPRSQAVKGLELTVLRALQLIEAFDALGEGEDWTDVPGSTYRKVIGDRYEHPRLLEECYNRWKGGTLHREVLDLYENLPPAAQSRKEIAIGIKEIQDRGNQVDRVRPKIGRLPQGKANKRPR